MAMSMTLCMNTFRLSDGTGSVQVMKDGVHYEINYYLRIIRNGKVWLREETYQSYGEAVKAAYELYPELKGYVGY